MFNKKMLRFFDLFFSYIAPIAYLIVVFAVKPHYPLGYKLGFAGLILISIIVLMGLRRYNRTLTDRMLTATNELARATEQTDKDKWAKKYDHWNAVKAIWNKLCFVLPFALFFVFVILVERVGEKIEMPTLYLLISEIIGAAFGVLNKIKRH